jgi:hypothetical protein
MISCFISIHFILDFTENIQKTNDVSSKSNSLNVTDTNVVLETPQKDPKKTFQKSHPLQESQSRLKDTGLFLSPATEKFHKTIDKETKLSAVVNNSETMKEVQKNIIQSMDHILNHDLVCENPAAATFVGTIERSMQEIKEELTRWSFQLLGQILVKAMRCVSHHTRIRRKSKWKNDSRVLLDRTHKLLVLWLSLLIPYIRIGFSYYKLV